MFEEFNHFFNEEYFDLSVDGIVLEAYSKKEKHRIDKFLKENKFKEDPDATTAEEKRKGYRRGTIETDIPDNKGGKKRVNFEITPHDADPGLTFKNEDKSASITMSKRTLARKPAVSNFIFKHEEGHAAVHLDESGKYVMEMEKVDKILTRLLHKMLTNKADALNEHDSNIEEFIADKYAKEHGLGVVKELCGHGVGTSVHESPDVPNYGKQGTGPLLREGMVIAVEPMLTLGSPSIYVDSNDWTIITQDHSPSAHYEHTVVVTKDGYEILTGE